MDSKEPIKLPFLNDSWFLVGLVVILHCNPGATTTAALGNLNSPLTDKKGDLLEDSRLIKTLSSSL